VNININGIAYSLPTPHKQGLPGPPARLCRFATTAALPAYTATAYTLVGVANGALPTTDGVAPAVGDLVFVKDETGGNAKNNGPYRIAALGSVSTPYQLSRATDVALDVIGVRLGTDNGRKIWMLTTDSTIVLGTTALTYSPLRT